MIIYRPLGFQFSGTGHPVAYTTGRDLSPSGLSGRKRERVLGQQNQSQFLLNLHPVLQPGGR